MSRLTLSVYPLIVGTRAGRCPPVAEGRRKPGPGAAGVRYDDTEALWQDGERCIAGLE